MKKEINMNNKGFTIIELLVAITILGILISITFFVMNRFVDNASEEVDDISKKMILDAANEYMLEFRGTSNWKEEKKDDGASFCISLDSLIYKGYFENKISNFEKFRSKYAVSCDVVDGIFNYKLVKLSELTGDHICQYSEKDYLLLEKDAETGEYVEVEEVYKNVEIINKGEQFGDFGYKINVDGTNRYKINTTMNIKINEIIKNNSNVFVNILLDESGSMTGVFNTARDSIIDFSNTLSEEGIKFSLIGLGDYPILRRDYDVVPLEEKDFIKHGNWAWATNSMAAVDLTTSLIFNAKNNEDNIVKMDENSRIYTIMFTDGIPYEWLWLEIDGNKLDVMEMYKSSYQFDENADARKYYYNYINLINYCDSKDEYTYNNYPAVNAKLECDINDNYKVIFKNNSASSTTTTKTAWEYLKYSSGFLKSIGSKMIVIAYGTDFRQKEFLTDIVSDDVDFCKSSSKTGYCYYYSENTNQVTELFNQFSTAFKELELLVDKIKLTLEPIVDSNGIPLVTIYDEDGTEINNFDEIYLNDNNMEYILLENKFSFVINEDVDLFNEENMECDEDGKKCTYVGNLPLLNIKFGFHYDGDSDDKWNYVDVVQPEFDLKLTKVSIIN